MGASKVIDAFVAYQFIKILSTPWGKTKAFELGIIDEKGKILKKSRKLKTKEEKLAYTMIHRLVWNIKRLLDKLPAGKTRIGSFTTALWMLREHSELVYGADFNLSNASFKKYLSEQYDIPAENLITESNGNNVLKKGKYQLKFDVDGPGQGSRKKDTFTVKRDLKADEMFAGEPIFMVKNDRTGQEMVVSHNDIKSINESYLNAPEFLIDPNPREITKEYNYITKKENLHTGVVRFMGNKDQIIVWDGQGTIHGDMLKKIKEPQSKFSYFGKAGVNAQGKIEKISYISHDTYRGDTDKDAKAEFVKYIKTNNPFLIDKNADI